MDTTQFSLADFYLADGDEITVPPEGFDDWMEQNRWAVSLLWPRLLGAAAPRLRIERAGQRRQVINLSSYNYLGLATHPEVLAAAARALATYGLGACGSPLLSGQTDLHEELAARLARLTASQDCMLYSSGFGGGMGSLAALLRKGDAAVLDERCHLCLMDGVRVSGARLTTFAHNDPEALDRALAAAAPRRRLVVVEGVYSMDGDTADLPGLLEVAEAHGVALFVDEAHSILVYGQGGGGLVEHCGVADRVALQFSTFSKAFAGVGGFTCAGAELVRYMRFYSNAHSFSCALPPVMVGGLLKGLEVATRDRTLQQRLWANTDYFRSQAAAMGLDLGRSTSQVIPIIVGADRERLYRLCLQMQERGLFLAPVDYPGVPEDGLRFRVAITAAHQRADLDEALQIIDDTIAVGRGDLTPARAGA